MLDTTRDRDAYFRARLFDVFAAALGLGLLGPVFAAITLAILLTDGSPVLFRQVRVGRKGRKFVLLKFRSMRAVPSGAPITADGDARITRCGKVLRKYKLDELPQLWNVLRGDMSVIGPRPEVPNFVDMTDAAWRSVLQVNPGITDLATLLHRDEEEILKGFGDVEEGYRDAVLPRKLALNLEYLRERSFWSDIKLLVLTARYSFLPSGFDPARIKRIIFGNN
jgi:lipopolysaccharide/colanic/teichoic acid biosynthesis glycosyltransferase